MEFDWVVSSMVALEKRTNSQCQVYESFTNGCAKDYSTSEARAADDVAKGWRVWKMYLHMSHV